MTEPTGVDLARVALAQARKAAKANGALAATGKQKPTRRRRTRSDGRDPVGLASAVNGLMNDRGWETPAAGATVVNAWPDIAPELCGKVTAIRYDADTGSLHLQPASPAFATHLRLLGAQLVKRVNTHIGGPTVRTIKVLPPGSTSTHTAGGQPPSEPGPGGDQALKTRSEGSPGYQTALAAHQRHKATAPAPSSAAWTTQQPQREPEEQFTDSQAALEEDRARQRVEEDPHARALRRARAERTARVKQAFQ